MSDLNVGCGKVETSALQQENSRMAEKVGNLDILVDSLCQVLVPILSDPGPQCETGDDASTTCEAGRQLREHSDKVNSIASRVQDILDRCQL